MGARRGEGLEELLALGLTYRQVSHWTTRGYLHARPKKYDVPGSGVPYIWDEVEVAVARQMIKLINDGFRVDAAARLAREGAVVSG